MSDDITVIRLRPPDEIDDPLTAILRSGPRRLLEQAVEAEVEAFLATMKKLKKELKLADRRDRVVRHGHGPKRAIQTGIGPVEVRRVKVRDRGAEPAGERIQFISAILPRWARRTTSLDALLPLLYLRGVSTGDFQEALLALLGKDAPNLSPARTYRRRSWDGSRRTGRPITHAGKGATCRRATTSTSGPMGSICRPVWSRWPSACW